MKYIIAILIIFWVGIILVTAATGTVSYSTPSWEDSWNSPGN